jgi:hypothetical protein
LSPGLTLICQTEPVTSDFNWSFAMGVPGLFYG